jgi:small GTP-binding protein
MSLDPISFRVVLVGDSEAGKTSIIHTFIRGQHEPNQKNTVGAVFHTILREVHGIKVQMQIWDTAGQEKYRSIGPIYYRNASAAIAVFDVRVEEFESNLDAWIVSVKRSAADPLIFIVGNKSDLLEDESMVMGRMQQLGEKYGAECLLTSAKTGANVSLLFEKILDGLVQSCTREMDVALAGEPEPVPVNNNCC